MWRNCPHCQTPVPFWRVFGTTAWGKYPCDNCGALLGTDVRRRIVAGLAWAALLLTAINTKLIFQLPSWVAIAGMLGMLLLFHFILDRPKLLRPPGLACEHCGYSLEGLPEQRCPECGRPFDYMERARALTNPPRTATRSLLFIMLILIATAVIGTGVAWYQSRRAALAAAQARAAQAATQSAGQTSAKVRKFLDGSAENGRNNGPDNDVDNGSGDGSDDGRGLGNANAGAPRSRGGDADEPGTARPSNHNGD